MIAASVKEARLAKGYTQKELSDLTNVSVRSIQRIENGEIVPRSYTLKTLAAALEISLEQAEVRESPLKTATGMTKSQKIVISAGLPLISFLACWAFIAQSPRFPETAFELIVLAIIMVLFITTALFFLWRRN
ncbi:helix-turn-helix domain-containing protein [Terrimonas sp. NA20]|uniref:Helix-turn-helix domain-containing protein n=1 Tax=Terrimonas ginsenosidimutans TaxID=2908004 RepID=A0ABS9KUG9_9BACT|nr:helix-turn-helix transcriptional regulator [Terrimonas ginsenosidimutans]MCG2615963.1 helix-turn-helix domain-containing protein [Terrimonas ginsenosidimutans]